MTPSQPTSNPNSNDASQPPSEKPKRSSREIGEALCRAGNQGIVDSNRKLAKSMALHRPNKTEEEIFQALMRNENP